MVDQGQKDGKSDDNPGRAQGPNGEIDPKTNPGGNNLNQE